MTTYTLDGAPLQPDAGLKTWGDLLSTVEVGNGPTRRIVTAVRFGGVDQPTFRRAEAMAAALAPICTVDIETASAEALVGEAASASLAALDPLAEALDQTARDYRLGHMPAAHAGLADIAGTVGALTRLTEAIDQMIDPGATGGHDAGAARAEAIVHLEAALAQIASDASSGDWDAVADGLTARLRPRLNAWRLLLPLSASNSPVSVSSLSSSTSPSRRSTL
jgi:hypothetical protein